MKILIILSSLIFNISLFGKVPTGNLLHDCQGSWNCKFKHTVLLEKQPYESDFEVEYVYTCKGHPIEVGIREGDESSKGFKNVFIRSNNMQKLSFSGMGPVITKDFNPKNLETAFLNDCKIEIHSAKVVGPSKNTIEKWNNQKIEKKNRIEEIKQAILGFESAVNYQGAFEIMKQTCNSFYAGLSSENLKKLLLSIDSVSALIPNIIASKGKALSADKIATLIKFMTLTKGATNSAFWLNEKGEVKKIEDFLSEQEKLILEDLANTFLSDKQFLEKELEKLNLQKRSLEAELYHLDAILKNYL